MSHSKQDYFLTSCLIPKKFAHSDSYLQHVSSSSSQSIPYQLKSFSTPFQIKKKSTNSVITTPHNNNFSLSRFTEGHSLLPSLNNNANANKNSSSPIPSPMFTSMDLTQAKLAKICTNGGKFKAKSSKLFEIFNQTVKKPLPLKARDKSLDFNEYLDMLKKRGADKNLGEHFRTSRKKHTTTIANMMTKMKMVRMLRGNSKGGTYLEKMRKFATLQRQVANKSPQEIIQELINLLELLRETFGSSNVALSSLRVLKGFKELENVFIEPDSKEFKLFYTIKQLKSGEMLKEENMQKVLMIRSELKAFMKKKQLELAELKAGLMEDDYDNLKKKTFGYLEDLKYRNKRKYNEEKEFLVGTLEFINNNQMVNKFKLNSLRELENTEKIVGKFDKINAISRMIAKSMDLICQKTGF